MAMVISLYDAHYDLLSGFEMKHTLVIVQNLLSGLFLRPFLQNLIVLILTLKFFIFTLVLVIIVLIMNKKVVY